VDHEFAKDLVAISAGTKHTACINKKGHAITFGCGGNGQTGLGQNNTGEQLEPKRIDKLAEAGVNLVSLSCGSIHTCFVTLEGEVYLCGFGEHFTPDESQHFFYDPKKCEMPEPIKQISCGQSHNIALSTTGNVYTWGSGDYGQLGYGVYGNLSVPRLVLEGKGMEQVAAGRYHSLALSNMGVLYSWGCGENGQLGQNSDENVALPTVVAPILGSVVGQVACGEHHTAVLSSAPWTKLAANMQEWDYAAKTEHEKKKERLKKTNRGLTAKDLAKVGEDMKKWQEQQDARKAAGETELMDEQERDINSIQLGGYMTEAQQEALGGPGVSTSQEGFGMQAGLGTSQTMKLPSVNDNRGGEGEEEELHSKAGGGVRLPKVSKKANFAQTQGFGADTTQPMGDNDVASKAPLTRTMFLKETAQMVKRMKTVVASNGETEGNRHLQQMMRLVYDLRKEYDYLANFSRQETKRTTALKKDVESSSKSSEIDKTSNDDASEKLKDLEMRLNTVTIKISETSENRRNYELNIAHLKEEDFEHFNQLKALRKQNHDNNNFFKKMNELKGTAQEEKERAEAELAEFQHEISAYQKFVQEQLGQFEQILDIVQKQNDTRTVQQEVRTKKVQDRVQLRIEKLETEAEEADKEAGGLSTRLTSLDLKLRHFEDSFQKITAATGLTNPHAIVNKFFFKEEIKEQLELEIADKEQKVQDLAEKNRELEVALAGSKDSFVEKKWRDVNVVEKANTDRLTEGAKVVEVVDKAQARIAFVQESLLSVFKSITATKRVDVGEFPLDFTSVWSPPQAVEMFTKLNPFLDELLEAERVHGLQKEEELRLQAEITKHNAVALEAFGLASLKKDEEVAPEDDYEDEVEN
jgi:hypothetical protein